MTPFTWIAGGLAALVAGLAILIKGGMVETPRRAGSSPTGGGSPSGEGIPGLGDEDIFRRFPGDRGPDPTQTDTGVLPPPGEWGDSPADGEPPWSYESPGDGGVQYPVAPPHTDPIFGGPSPTQPVAPPMFGPSPTSPSAPSRSDPIFAPAPSPTSPFVPQ